MSRYELATKLVHGDASILTAVQTVAPKGLLRVMVNEAEGTIPLTTGLQVLSSAGNADSLPGPFAGSIAVHAMKSGAMNVAVRFGGEVGFLTKHLPGEAFSRFMGWVGDNRFLAPIAKRAYGHLLKIDPTLMVGKPTLSAYFARAIETGTAFAANARNGAAKMRSAVHAQFTQLGWNLTPKDPLFAVRMGELPAKTDGVADLNQLLGRRLEDGKKHLAAVFNLKPWNLHSGCFPFDEAELVSIKRMVGTTAESVGDRVIEAKPNLLATNPRTVFTFKKGEHIFDIVFVDAKGVARLNLSDEIVNGIHSEKPEIIPMTLINDTWEYTFSTPLKIKQSDLLANYRFGWGLDARRRPSTAILVAPMEMLGDATAQKQAIAALLPKINTIVTPGEVMIP